jgi:15-cis-phytoene synthase
MDLYAKTSFKISHIVTRNYSTSFFIATCLMEKCMQDAIHSIYAFVRFADEIVDSFHEFDKKYLLEKFENDYYEAVNLGISLNPVLHSFQLTVNKYKIHDEHIQSFLKSMKHDLEKNEFNNKSEINEYIYGSADVVGLMCLKIFCDGDDKLYKELEHSAMKLGSAFQKVNFLRDLKNDMEKLGRRYFADIDQYNFNESTKTELIRDIENDFDSAFAGIKKLPKRSKLAVLIAFYYYRNLLKKIKKTPANKMIDNRIRIANTKKMLLLLKAAFVYKLKLI